MSLRISVSVHSLIMLYSLSEKSVFVGRPPPPNFGVISTVFSDNEWSDRFAGGRLCCEFKDLKSFYIAQRNK